MEIFFAHRVETHNLFLDEEESHHCMKVMRHQVGDELTVTNGAGKLFAAKIIGNEKKEVMLEILQLKKEEPVPSPQIHIAIAPTKIIDRFEWFLEKATEIGITEISPIICKRSERDKIKPERLQKILTGAMKQSLRVWLPELNPQISFSKFFDSVLTSRDSKLIAHCQSQNLPTLKSLCKQNENVLIMIGPEGDFTVDEIKLAEANEFTAVTLGTNRLRTETAGIVAVHTVHLLNS